MFGDTEIKDTIVSRLDKWFNDPPDYHDVEQAYKLKGQLEAREITLKNEIDRTEKETVLEHGQPRSNAARILKLNATKELRDKLAAVEADLKHVENAVKFLEFRKAMFSAAVFRIKIQMDL